MSLKLKTNQLLNKIESEEQFEKGEKENIEFQEKRNKYIIKGIISIISCIIHMLGYFSVYIQKNFIVYLISFRRHYQEKLTFSYGYFLFPVLNLTTTFTIPIGGFLEDKLGPRTTIILSTSILCSSYTLLYFSRNIFFDYFLMSLNGFAIAIGINITKKNACAYFMNRKVFVYGIAHLIAAFSCSGLNYFFEKIILNPLSESPTIENIYYGEKIFMNYQKLIIFEIIFLIITCLITLLLFIKNNTKETKKFGFDEKVEKKDDQEEKENKLISKDIKIKKAAFSKRALRLFIMLFLYFPTIHFLLNTWRPIGIYYKINTYYLQITTALYSISSSLASILMALIGDKIQFRIIFIFFSFLISLISFSFPYTFNNDILFICEVLSVAFIFNGFNIIIGPHIMKIFGIDIYTEISGIIGCSVGISEIFCVIFAFYLENNSSLDKNITFRLMYGFSGILNVISIIFGLFEKDDKFIF